MSCNINSILQRRIAPGLSALILSTAVFGTAHAAPQETILYRFTNADPEWPLVMDSGGAFYGATAGGTPVGVTLNEVFRLSPPISPAKLWHFQVLRRFNFADRIDGWEISALAIVPKTSTLYGTTYTGGRCAPKSGEACGTAFSLSPPAPSHSVWGFDPIFKFGKAAVTADTPQYIVAGADGALYGTSVFGVGTTVKTYGTIFKLSPPATPGGSWSDTVLYSFQGGADGEAGSILPPDATGTIYGETSGGGTCPGNLCGTIFKLNPPNGAETTWTKTVLYSFQGGDDGREPDSPLIADSSGALYGLTYYGGDTSCGGGVGCGTVYRLSPPSGTSTVWSESVFYRFHGAADGSLPQGTIGLDQYGVMYGITSGLNAGGSNLGTVWKLTPPSQGSTEWTKTILHSFKGGVDGSDPNNGVIIDKNGVIYGTTGNGGSGSSSNSGYGVIYKITQ